MIYKKQVRIFVLFFAMLTLSACSKEKAEAIKIAAENFRSDAVLAIDKVNKLFDQNISVAKFSEQKIEKIVSDLEGLGSSETAINSEILDEWFKEEHIGDVSNAIHKEEFNKIKKRFTAFEAMFTNLEKGHYFAKDAVKKAEKYAINLSLDLIHYSKTLESNSFRNMSERVLIIERIEEARFEENDEFQKTLRENVARDIIALEIRETQLKEDAIRQCLMAADRGKIVAELIKDYDKLNIGDILKIVKNSMNYGIDITGNKKLNDLMKKFEGVETEIKDDPYWKVLIDKQIN